ncbi:OLC1v1031101C1 [Oldenlandia corymbosa var. corymbosa]|uniref:OLC1v1031101C1 n=1 Tax=Oldenlandia corymbosa var. corymbosa TaxID=529605 RepID=A0AAV1CKQ2_OLDCO|nr:OLC1v1031101C1 [Oldenlandia corymbosa var. corymbosa]
MSDSGQWADFTDAIDVVEDMIEGKNHRWFFLPNRMDSVVTELKFLYTFLGCVHMCSKDESSPSESSSCSSSTFHNMSLDTLFMNVAAAAKELIICLQNALSRGDSRREPFESLDVVKAEVKAAYQGSLSKQLFRCRAPSTRSLSWYHFSLSLKSNLRILSENASLRLDDHLRKQLKALEWTLHSLNWLFSGDGFGWSPWERNMLAYFGGLVVQVAHLCCWLWFARVDQSMDRDVATSLSDLHRKIDPETPEFLDVALTFAGRIYGGVHPERSIFSFLQYILGLQDERLVLHKEFVSVISCLIKIPEDMQFRDVNSILVAVKDVIKQARHVIGRNRRPDKTDYAILFSKIWSLKAEIFIKSNGALIRYSMNDHVEALNEGYRFIEQIPCPTIKESVDDQILKLIEGVPGQVLSLYRSSPFGDKLVHIRVSNSLYKNLVHILLLKAKALLLETLEKDSHTMLPLKSKIGALHEGLFLFTDTVINKTKEITMDEKLILKDFERVATGVISLSPTFPADYLTEEGVKILDVGLLDLLERVQKLKARVKGLYNAIPQFNLPQTPGLCFIELLLQNLRGLLNRKLESTARAAHQIEDICTDLEFLVSNQDVFEQAFVKQECKDLHKQLVCAAYQAERVIDLMQSEDSMWEHYLWLFHLSEEIKHVKTKMQQSSFKENSNYNDGVENVTQRSMPVVSPVATSTIEEVMVGLADQKEELIDTLIRGTLERKIIAIVGMPGIGKTTFVKNVFCTPNVFYHFTIRACCYVSQKYKKRDLLLEILSHIITVTDNTHAMSDSDLQELLYKQLKGKRYLIIMDDVWSTKAWHDLQLSFPNDSNGSRILMTSRLQDVVSKISDPYPLRLLSVDESWELLKIKVLQEKTCPKKLLEVGKQIAKNCNGLPLAISAIGGLLNRTCGKNQDSWKKVAECVSSHVINDPVIQCRKIVEMSYNHLPDHLKACLLYLGTFPEDKDIPIWRLLCLWLAEGFVHQLESNNAKDLAEGYLMDLVGRSLVIVAKRGSNGGVKACRVHDIVRDLCLLRAKDDHFLQPISGNDEPYSSFDSLDHDVPLELLNISRCTTYEEYRLCFLVNREHFVASRPSGPHVRSLLYFATTDMYPRCPYDVSFIPNNYKRLRVLDLESINMGSSLANGIDLLVDLRYLAVCGDMESIPSSLCNLENLETLVVKGLKRKVVLPDTIWRMKRLRHIRVSKFAIFTLPYVEDGNSPLLEKLISLSFPCFICGEKASNDLVLRFPILQELRCIVLEPRDVTVDCFQFPALESLCKLESLKMSYYGKLMNAEGLNLPFSLKKLTLSNFRLPWSHISAIGRLHNLEVLKLISRAFEGSSWEMAEGEFVNLTYLKLDGLNIAHWDAFSDHLPQLRQLVVRNCEWLEEIPFDFVNISTLQKIEVQQCGVSVEQSVRRIENQGMEGLNIVINNLHLQ